jgi:seryl-tRNA synthetase
LNVKYTDSEGNKKFAYLLNNTAMPSVRPLIAIIENYQQADGSILIPDVLKKYLPDGLDRITKNNKTQKQ